MSIDKPWMKEYDKLLNEMKALWGDHSKEVNNPDDKSFSISSYYVYPILNTNIDGFDVQVTVSKNILPGAGAIQSSDNIEYLSILLITPCTLKAAIRHESFTDRFKKKLALEFEAQTGNEKFDKDYFLITRPKEDIQLLKSNQVQNEIRGLEPFSGLVFTKGGINSTHLIEDKSILNIQNIKRIIMQLIVLANLVK